MSNLCGSKSTKSSNLFGKQVYFQNKLIKNCMGKPQNEDLADMMK
jgi:hypothetical protein